MFSPLPVRIMSVYKPWIISYMDVRDFGPTDQFPDVAIPALRDLTC